MNFILGIVGKFGAAKKVLDWLDGKKTYIAGTAGVLMGAAQLLMEVATLSGLPAYYTFAQNLPHDQGLLTILGGLTALGLRHAVEKATPDSPAAAPAPTPPAA